MKAKKGDFIEVDYTGIIKERNIVFDTTNEKAAKEGSIYSSNVDYKPIVICLGNNELVHGLDEFLVGKDVNVDYTVELKPKEAFGEKDSRLYQLVNTSKFLKQNVRPYPGLQVNIDNAYGVVKTVSGGRTMVDFNHPLAGKEILYKVKIIRILDNENDKIQSCIEKILGKATKFNFSDGKLVIDFDGNKEAESMISEEIKRLVPSVKAIEFKKN